MEGNIKTCIQEYVRFRQTSTLACTVMSLDSLVILSSPEVGRCQDINSKYCSSFHKNVNTYLHFTTFTTFWLKRITSTQRSRFLVPGIEVQDACFWTCLEFSMLLTFSSRNHDLFGASKRYLLSFSEQDFLGLNWKLHLMQGECCFNSCPHVSVYYTSGISDCPNYDYFRGSKTPKTVEPAKQDIAFLHMFNVKLWPQKAQDGPVCIIQPPGVTGAGEGWKLLANRLVFQE